MGVPHAGRVRGCAGRRVPERNAGAVGKGAEFRVVRLPAGMLEGALAFRGGGAPKNGWAAERPTGSK